MSTPSPRRRPGGRSFLAAGASLLMAFAWWTGVLAPDRAPVPGGFGTSFALVALFCLAQGLREVREVRRRRRDRAAGG